MITAVTYWFMKLQFDKDWNMGVLLLPLVWDLLLTAAWMMWLYKW